jgi:Domain of unknown function (DUF5050)
MNRSQAFQGLGLVLMATPLALAGGFTGCSSGTSGAGGSASTTTTTASGTSTTGDTTSATSTSTATTGTGGTGGGTSTGTGTSTSTGAGGTGGMPLCAGCTTVATLTPGSKPFAIQVDATNVYWTNIGTNEVMQIKTDGTGQKTLATMQNTPFALQLAGGSVYWVSYSATGVMRKVPIGGGAVTDLIDAPASRDLVVGTNYIWWAREPDDIQRVPIGGIVGDAAAPDLLTNNPLSNGIASDGTSVFWVTRQDGYVKKSDPDFGNETPLATGDVPWDIAVDATTVYWTEQGSAPASGKVMKVQKDGTGTTTLAMGQQDPQGMAIDATAVYWANKTDGTICKVPLAGGTVTVLAKDQMDPENVAVDATSVYWTNTKGDTIVKVAK